MSKLGLPLAIVIALGAAGNASAFQLKGTPYTFTGSVTSATPSCPYAAKTKLAGYTLIQNDYNYPPPNYQPKLAGFRGPALIFSPGGTADKVTMKIDNLPLRSGAISGNAAVIVLPNLGTIKGTYKGTMSISPNKTFTLNYTSKFTNKGALCTTTFDIAFKIGIPTKLLDLL